MKFLPKFIGPGRNPILMVGMNPGKQYKFTGICWENNRSADFMKMIIAGRTNIIMTNVCNYRDISNKRIKSGMKDLEKLIELYEPKVIIYLGDFAESYCRKLDIYKTKSLEEFHFFYHPSYILRFKRNDKLMGKYISSLRNVLDKGGE